MTDEQYRLGKLVVLAIFVVGSLLIGWRFAENGRYRQYDHRMNFDGTRSANDWLFYDSRTGNRRY